MPAPSDANPPEPVRRYDIVHRTAFTYSAPVKLDQLVVRLQPRTSFDQRLVAFSIECDPQPMRSTYCLDLHGNIRHWFWFGESHEQLTLTTRSTVDCLVSNPFDYIAVDPGVLKLPATYAEPVNAASAHYREREHPNPEVDALARQLAREHGADTVAFLSGLAQYLQSSIRYLVRPDGDPWSPTKTLERCEGSCRDTAVLFMDACRAAGLATRFVSGYAWDAHDAHRRELHAWAEVYLPGAGWRGYDPTTGLAVANRHVAVAASPTSAYAAPTEGTFTGPRVDTSLSYDIQMTSTDVGPSEPPPVVTYVWPM